MRPLSNNDRETQVGTPITEEDLLSLSAIGNDYPVAREVYADLRSEPYITHRGNRGIELDKSNFDKLADVLTMNVAGKRGRLRLV